VTDHFSLPGQGQYLVMDFVDGEDLESMVQRQVAFSPAQAINWITQIADALSYLHSQNPPVIHRDVKPANVRIAPDGKAMLVDFGLVKASDPQQKTTMGARAVTPGYSPPEQYGQGNTDARTDIYALAATLYILLTGLEPQESVQRVVNDALRPAHQVNPQVTPEVGRTIARAMALSPAQRHLTIADFKSALIAPPIVAQPPTPILSSLSSALQQQRSTTGRGSKPLHVVFVMGAIGIGGLLAIGALAIMWLLQRPPQEPQVVIQPVVVTATPDWSATAQAPQVATLDVDATVTAEAATLATALARQIATMQAQPTATIQARAPRIYNFFVCSQPCDETGANASRTFPGGIKKIYARWSYENIPVGAQYTRAWTMDGQEWVRYNCTWPGPETGVDTVTLTEPDGLHSGTWEVTIAIDGVTLLREQIVVEGNWTFWTPAGEFNTCYGKR
jgi:hypothetical protein